MGYTEANQGRHRCSSATELIHDLTRCVKQRKVDNAGDSDCESRFFGGHVNEECPEWKTNLARSAKHPENGRTDANGEQFLAFAFHDLNGVSERCRLGR